MVDLILFTSIQKTRAVFGSSKIITCILFFLPNVIASQSLPISIDGQLNDWTTEAIEVTDPNDDGDVIEILRMAVANNETHLFIQLELENEINFTKDHNLTLYIDTDLNANTGNLFNGIGAELEINFGNRDAFYKLPSGQGVMSLNDLRFRHLPSVSSKVFEMAFDLNAVSNAGFDLFTANGVRLVWKDETGPFGDALPDNGTVFTYLFDETQVPGYEPVLLEKENESALRLLTWNTLHNGLDDVERKEVFEKITNVIQPDIVTFNECWDINPFQVASFMNGAAPLPNFDNWQTVKLDGGNVTASRYPILQNWVILQNQRLTASLIDIPSDVSSKDLLVVNAHFRCCENDFDRQREADAFVEFILDAKTPGGIIDLPEGTPFVLSGDLNLVGDGQQLTTLLTGDVVNNNQFGPDGDMDWDGSNLVDVISLHTDDRFAYTWKNIFSSFPPSRIDFHIISGSVLSVDKSYTLLTETMSEDRLAAYGLEFSDTYLASDHLPKVTDLLLPLPVSIIDLTEAFNLIVFPNPMGGFCKIDIELKQPQQVTFSITNVSGQTVLNKSLSFPKGRQLVNFNVKHLSAGVYFLNLKTANGSGTIKLVKK